MRALVCAVVVVLAAPLGTGREAWSHAACARADFEAVVNAAGAALRDLTQQTRAILRYNNSMAYVANVMAWAGSYASGTAPKPGDLSRI